MHPANKEQIHYKNPSIHPHTTQIVLNSPNSSQNTDIKADNKIKINQF